MPNPALANLALCFQCVGQRCLAIGGQRQQLPCLAQQLHRVHKRGDIGAALRGGHRRCARQAALQDLGAGGLGGHLVGCWLRLLVLLGKGLRAGEGPGFGGSCLLGCGRGSSWLAAGLAGAGGW